MEKPRAVLFDAYGTLFDVYSVGLLAEQLFPGQGAALGVAWRDKQIEYTRLLTTSNHGAHYQPFWAVTRAALRYACARLDLRLDEAGERALMNQYNHLSAFPDSRPVLQALQARVGDIEARMKRTAAAPRRTAELAKPKLPEPPFNVVGVELRGGERFLSVTAPKASSVLDVWLLREGDAVGAWHLLAIEARAAVFRVDGQAQRIALP